MLIDNGQEGLAPHPVAGQLPGDSGKARGRKNVGILPRFATDDTMRGGIKLGGADSATVINLNGPQMRLWSGLGGVQSLGENAFPRYRYNQGTKNHWISQSHSLIRFDGGQREGIGSGWWRTSNRGKCFPIRKISPPLSVPWPQEAKHPKSELPPRR